MRTAAVSFRQLSPHFVCAWLALLALVLLSAAPAQATERRFALVIGNSAYDEGPLKNPVNDARDMRAKLQQLGFAPGDVVYRENLRRDQIGSTLREFRAKLQASPGAVALVFYAGHGVQFKGENYFPAVDARLEGEEDTPLQSLHLRSLMDVLAESRTRLNLVFLDACRNNPFARSFRSGTRGLGRTADAMPSGTLIAYATGANNVAADGQGRNAPFTAALLQHLGAPGQPVEQVLKRVVRTVRENTQGAQVPWSEGSIDGDFYFRPGAVAGGTNVDPVATVAPEPVTPGLDLSDLAGQAAQQLEAQRRDQATLARLQGDFDKVAGFGGTAALQVQAWERFLTIWSAPQAATAGLNGTALRQQAQQRRDQAQAQAREEAQTLAQPASISRPTQVQAGGAQTFSVNGVSFRMQAIPAGGFLMGSPEGEPGRDSDEGPQRRVSLRAFQLGQTEVTQGLWQAVMGSNPSDFKDCGADCPVESVSWVDAQTFIQKLNQATAQQFRLPSEAEWEYAARAGCESAFNVGGQCRSKIEASEANFNGNHTFNGSAKGEYRGQTIRTGSFPANTWGLQDMHGNVWEWVQDCLGSYSAAPSEGSAASANSCSRRVVRGGAWGLISRGLRSAYRSGNAPDHRDISTGFRLARSVF